VLRGFDYGLLAMLGVAVVYGVAWSIVALSLGLLAVAIGGGWVIGAAIRRGVASRAAGAQSVADEADVSPIPPSTRGMSTLGALLGAGAWMLGSFVAFAIVQLTQGSGGLLERLTPDRFAEHMTATLQLEPTLLQPAVLAAFVAVAWLTARPELPRPATAGR
jgi:hypothetical protein